LQEHYACYKSVRRHINGEDRDGLIGRISLGHRYFGFNRGEMNGQNGVWYDEWAPGADYLALIGDFNDWNKHAHSLVRNDHGIWHIYLPDTHHGDLLKHEEC